MARWGRLTDLEWIYEVTLDAAGQPVTAVYSLPTTAGKGRWAAFPGPTG